MDRPIYLPPSPRTIVDLGCWQGVTTKAYADLYPSAQIVGVEMMYDNYIKACELLDPYGDRITLRNIGVWSHTGEVECAIWGSETSHVRATREPLQGYLTTLPCTTLDDITSHLNYIDFIKIDIEAAEHEVIRHGGAWVEKTRSLFVEIHDVSNDTVRGLLEMQGFTITNEEFEKIWAIR